MFLEGLPKQFGSLAGLGDIFCKYFPKGYNFA
jgi:hypothetical protein